MRKRLRPEPDRRALSLRGALWQSPGCNASGSAMKRVLVIASLGLVALGTGAAAAPLRTMPIGSYRCELPGDVLGPAGIHVPEEDFRIVNASSYRIGDTLGSYFLRGDTLYMTSGPFRGNRYRRISRILLRKQAPDGTDSNLRCARLMLAE